MKRRSIVTIALVLSMFFFKIQAQGQHLSVVDPEFNNYYLKTKPPVVSGKIIHATKEELAQLTVTYSVVTPFNSFQKGGAAKINTDGSFRFVLDYPFTYQQVWFTVGKIFYSGLYVNSDLTVELDYAKLKKQALSFVGDGIRYGGTDGGITAWMNKALIYRRNDQAAVFDKLQYMNQQSPNFIAQLDSVFAVYKQLQDEFVQQNPSPYVWLLENERLSEYYNYVLGYSIGNKSRPENWDQIRMHRPLAISNSGMALGKNLFNYILFVELSKQDGTHVNLMHSLLGQSYSDLLILQKADEGIKEHLDQINAMIKNSGIKTTWVKMVLEQQYRQNVAQTDKVNALLKKSAVAADSVIGKPIGKLPFGASLTTVGGTSAETFLNNLKNKFKGKALLLDFWATWCGPCLRDMPYSLKLHEAANDLPIAFVYICSSNNSNIDRWKAKINELKLPGTHIYMDEELCKQIMALFGKSGFPSFVGLDQSGQVSSHTFRFMQESSLDDVKLLLK